MPCFLSTSPPGYASFRSIGNIRSLLQIGTAKISVNFEVHNPNIDNTVKQAMVKSKRPSHGVQSAIDVLDPAEVMKAMLAQKGKGREVESGSEAADSDGDEEPRSQASGTDAETDTEDEDGDSGSGSEAESSRSAELRSRKQSHSPSRVIQQPASRIAPAPPTSRVKLEPRSSLSVFDQTPKPPAVTSFESLGMSKPLISALASINIKKPTEIQAACVGAIMSGRDCIGGAKTGSGKTLAFALPIVERIARDPFGVWAVVLTPTR